MSVSEERPTRRLQHIDGLRGLAALCIASCHVLVGDRLAVAAVLAVGVFIVLSGYCLMLPVVARGGRLRESVIQFFARRASRILPPYYAAIGLTAIASLWQLHHAPERGGGWWMANLAPANIAAHLALVHNVRPDWASSLDPPMWTVVQFAHVGAAVQPALSRYLALPFALAFCYGFYLLFERPSERRRKVQAVAHSVPSGVA